MENNLRHNPLANDLNHILIYTKGIWEEIRGKRLFITGGTGFFGCWLLESFAWANKELGLNSNAVVLTRDYVAFKKKAPHLANNPAIQFHIGDVKNFDFPKGEFTHIIHLASASAAGKFHNEDPLSRFDAIVEGTRHVLDFAVQCNTENFLYTSSGNIYGKQPSNITHISEDYCGAPEPDDSNAALGVGKRAAEFLCMTYSQKYGIETKIARCFSFVGPYLQLDIHYAIGNFIRDGLNGGPILINSDGTAIRSYLYATDLIIWLWTILFKGKSCFHYNVGSEDAITIAELANIVAQCFKKPIEVRIAKSSTPDSPPDRYVPSTKRAQMNLGLRQIVNLRTAIERTISHVESHRMLYG